MISTVISAWHSAVRPEHGWPLVWPLQPARTRSCVWRRRDHRAGQPPRHACSGLMTGRGGAAAATEQFWSASRGTRSSICYRIGRPRRLPGGSAITRGSRSSPAIVPAPMLTGSVRGPPRRSRSPIGGTCSVILALPSRRSRIGSVRQQAVLPMPSERISSRGRRWYNPAQPSYRSLRLSDPAMRRVPVGKVGSKRLLECVRQA